MKSTAPQLPEIPAWTPPPVPSSEEVNAQYESALAACRDRSIRSYFDLEVEGDHFVMDTRDGGDICEETAGQADIDQGRKIRKEIKARFPLIRTAIEAVDEWVHVTVYNQPVPPPKRPSLGFEFWQQVGGALTSELESNGVKLVDSFAIFDIRGSFCIRIPVCSYNERDAESARECKLLAKTVLEKFLKQARGFGGGGYDVTAAEQSASLEFNGRPPWISK